jgi:hypothetical protein
MAGLAIFFWSSPISRLRTPILVFDAAGLALFAVAGTTKALAFQLNPLMAALLGPIRPTAALAAKIPRDQPLRVKQTPINLKKSFQS